MHDVLSAGSSIALNESHAAERRPLPAVGAVALRFFVVFALLNVLPAFPEHWISWEAATIFHWQQPLVVRTTGSGDRAVDWLYAFSTTAVALAVTPIWCALVWRRRRDERLLKWTRLITRFMLARVLIGYGLLKVFPLQMSAPSLTRLVEPYGRSSPMGLLWTFIGASSAYERFAGAIEVAAAVLILVPWTVPLGALLSVVAMLQVFVLNLAYDVPVKLYSFELLAASLFLLAPHAGALMRVLITNVSNWTSLDLSWGRTPRRRAAWIAAQAAVAAVIVVSTWSGARGMWRQNGAPTTLSVPLHGIWNITGLSVAGEPQTLTLTDLTQWRRFIFDQRTIMAVQRMDDTVVSRRVAIDANEQTITVQRAGSLSGGTLSFEHGDDTHLVLSGTLDDRAIVVRLERADDSSLLLVNRGFHWIQDVPFNR